MTCLTVAGRGDVYALTRQVRESLVFDSERCTRAQHSTPSPAWTDSDKGS
jgi:hypothetical protein